MKRRSPLFWPVAAAFIATVLWWSFHIPRTPASLYRAIPVQADVLSVHRDLAGRWNDIGRSTLIETVFASMGMKPAEVKNLNASAQFRDWLNRLLSDEFVLAEVPHIAGGKTAWVLAAWIGGNSQVLRLGLQLSTVPDLQFVGKRHGWPVWLVPSSRSKEGEVFSFSIVEGMIVATFARDDDALNAVLACIDGNYPSLATHPEAYVPDNPPDRGWFRADGEGGGFTRMARAQFALTTFCSNRLAGTVQLPQTWFEDAGTIQPNAATSFAAIQTDLPAAVAILPPSLAEKWIAPDKNDGFATSLAKLIRSQADGPLVASLFAGDYRGKFLQIRVPGIVISTASTNVSVVAEQAGAVVAGINEAHPWKLEMEKEETPDARVWSIVSHASNTVYGMSKPGDQIAVLSGSNWAGVASCAGAFKKIANDAVLRANRPIRLNVAAESAASHKASAYAWINLTDSAPAVRTATGTWVMRLKSENTRESQALRTQINDAMFWFYGLRPLGSVELFASPRDGGTLIEFATTPDE